jgi:hypothetical protein
MAFMEPTPASELGAIVETYRHVQAEYRLAGPEGTVRRHLRDRLEQLEDEFERLLEQFVPDQAERDAWRASLHHGWPSPPARAWPPELLFRGRAETGSVVEIHRSTDDEAEVLIDGRLAERLTGDIDGDVLMLDDIAYTETFAASPAALRALRAWVDDPTGPPPSEHASELLEDGLIDRHFGLTPRGRRALRHGAA